MPRPRTRAGRDGLAALVADPARALVALDYDGTLAPMVARPEQAHPAPGAIEVLARLAPRVAELVIITGRQVGAVLQLSGVVGVPGLERLRVLGQYGAERWDAASNTTETTEVSDGVRRLRAALPGVLLGEGADPTVWVEDKQTALVVHTRAAAHPQAELERLEPVLREHALAAGLEPHRGRLVLELRPPGADKGQALLSRVEAVGARSVLFAGDDLGDLPAVEAVHRLQQQRVAGVSVCSDSGDVPELARACDLRVDGPAGVVALLQLLAGA